MQLQSKWLQNILSQRGSNLSDQKEIESKNIMAEQNGNNLYKVGENIREIRKKKGLTLTELASLSGHSAPFLSQIENGRVNINLTTLAKICNGLDISIASLFEEAKSDNVRVIRRDSRKWYPLAGRSVESILLDTKSNIEFCVIHIPAGENSGASNHHPGDEICYVKKGSIRTILNEETIYDLNEGDIIYYDSEISHRWENISTEKAELILINSPATY